MSDDQAILLVAVVGVLLLIAVIGGFDIGRRGDDR